MGARNWEHLLQWESQAGGCLTINVLIPFFSCFLTHGLYALNANCIWIQKCSNGYFLLLLLHPKKVSVFFLLKCKAILSLDCSWALIHAFQVFYYVYPVGWCPIDSSNPSCPEIKLPPSPQNLLSSLVCEWHYYLPSHPSQKPGIGPDVLISPRLIVFLLQMFCQAKSLLSLPPLFYFGPPSLTLITTVLKLSLQGCCS